MKIQLLMVMMMTELFTTNQSIVLTSQGQLPLFVCCDFFFCHDNFQFIVKKYLKLYFIASSFAVK